MRTFIKNFILLLALLGMTAYFFSDVDNVRHDSSNLRAVNDHDIVIGEYFFTDEATFNHTAQLLFTDLKITNIIKQAFGIVTPIRIALLSSGGYLYLYERLAGNRILKDAYIVCTVATAESVAFTFMIDFCDERIMLPNAKVLTHKAYALDIFGRKIFTDSNMRATIAHSDMEAEVLGIDKGEWFKISRMNGDKYYSREELEKYKIATKFIED